MPRWTSIRAASRFNSQKQNSEANVTACHEGGEASCNTPAARPISIPCPPIPTCVAPQGLLQGQDTAKSKAKRNQRKTNQRNSFIFISHIYIYIYIYIYIRSQGWESATWGSVSDTTRTSNFAAMMMMDGSGDLLVTNKKHACAEFEGHIRTRKGQPNHPGGTTEATKKRTCVRITPQRGIHHSHWAAPTCRLMNNCHDKVLEIRFHDQSEHHARSFPSSRHTTRARALRACIVHGKEGAMDDGCLMVITKIPLTMTIN